ncbi:MULTISPECIES: AMP-binding enzyme [unclassified Nesterenkonia]|uniref:AMP-binding enzyme n=1 Tax=unclassified Nesterenkonia TaxID=2629769 RepID=UPI001F4C5AC4|nr:MULTISPECIES: AMP-binding protein [unclassified Nesterenkonia]MCH8559245.1 AMP-binding protein [Nesterenkonia sp. DZ6]MCH8571590.1 AMP-binding protein [Nesterenkonia sp. AY15]
MSDKVPADDSAGRRRAVLEPLRGADHATVLKTALKIRAQGGVPLIGDERWDDQHWRELVTASSQHALPEDAAWAGFTSGSTAAPRVVVRSHASWACSFPVIDKLLGARPGDSMLIPVHPVSSMALYAAAHAQSSGLRFTVPHTARLRAADLDGPGLMHGTPWHLREVVSLVQAGAHCTLRAVLIGGDRLDQNLAMQARQLGLSVVTYAGAAELSFVAVDAGAGLRSFPGVQLKVDDCGVLWVRTEQVCSTVIGKGSSLRTAGGSDLEPQSGVYPWVTVGDQASLTDGVLTLHGRSGDAILTAGATVLPSDVEAVLSRLPGVRASLVVAAPDRALGQRVAAFIEPEPAAVLDQGALLRAARAELTPAQYPRVTRLVASLPRTGSGKVRRLSYTDAQRLEAT